MAEGLFEEVGDTLLVEPVVCPFACPFDRSYEEVEVGSREDNWIGMELGMLVAVVE